MTDNIRITFGIIVLNGEPFTRYNIRSLYPFAHQIIIVEGACPAAQNIATPDGHSLDGTLEILREFKKTEDPENKLIIVTAEDEGHSDGFWTEKDEMSQAYAKRATGNYLWQVDSDEFYREEDMYKVIDMLKSAPDITAVSFRQITFWGGFDYVADGYYLKSGADIYHRLFKWGKGYTYVKHRPPTVTNESGIDLRDLKYVSSNVLSKKGILLYHYSLLFPGQVGNKCNYYSSVDWIDRHEAMSWADEVHGSLKRPFRVHNVYEYISWLSRFNGEHPAQIEKLRSDIDSGLANARLRDNNDVEVLINSRLYSMAKIFLIVGFPVYKLARGLNLKCRRIAKKVLGRSK